MHMLAGHHSQPHTERQVRLTGEAHLPLPPRLAHGSVQAGPKGAEEINTDDEVDEEGEYEQWKLREMRRIARDRCCRWRFKLLKFAFELCLVLEATWAEGLLPPAAGSCRSFTAPALRAPHLACAIAPAPSRPLLSPNCALTTKLLGGGACCPSVVAPPARVCPLNNE